MSGGPYGHNLFDTQTPTMTAGAYSADDALGGKLTFQLGPKPDFGGIISKLVLKDTAKQAKRFYLVLFKANFTATADNAAFAVSEADMSNCIGHITVEAQHWAQFSATAEATVECTFPYITDNTGKLYGQLMERDGGTYTKTNNITVDLTALSNT